MRDLLPDLGKWIERGDAIALASVVSTWGSAPRGVGAYMAINAAGQMIGSVSGGCVEGAVIERAGEVIRSGVAEYLHFGVANETAWDVGLACGGKIDVFVQAVEGEASRKLIHEIEQDHFVSHSSVVKGPVEMLGATLVATEKEILYSSASIKKLETAIWKEASSTTRKAKTIRIDDAGIEIFINPILPSPTLVIIGGVQIAIALAKIAKLMHFRPVLIDPRRAFLNADRFENLGQIVQAWPEKAYLKLALDRNFAIASLTHDPKIDDPALTGALKSNAFYVGALGSKKTQAKRISRLRELGFKERDLERIQGPIGLEIGAANPEEIALAIMGQVVQAYRESAPKM